MLRRQIEIELSNSIEFASKFCFRISFEFLFQFRGNIPHLIYSHIMRAYVFCLDAPFVMKISISSTTDLYHAYRNLDTSSLHDSNTINQNFSSQPYFDFSVARNVTTRVGQTAFLNCRVEQLGDKLVRFSFIFLRSTLGSPPEPVIFFNLDELSRLSHIAMEWNFSFASFLTRFCAGELDSQKRPSYIKCWVINVHIWRAISGELFRRISIKKQGS